MAEKFKLHDSVVSSQEEFEEAFETKGAFYDNTELRQFYETDRVGLSILLRSNPDNIETEIEKKIDRNLSASERDQRKNELLGRFTKHKEQLDALKQEWEKAKESQKYLKDFLSEAFKVPGMWSENAEMKDLKKSDPEGLKLYYDLLRNYYAEPPQSGENQVEFKASASQDGKTEINVTLPDPAGFAFEIKDGKVHVTDNLNAEQIKALQHLFWKLGVENYAFADPQLVEKYNRAAEESNEELWEHHNNIADSDSVVADLKKFRDDVKNNAILILKKKEGKTFFAEKKDGGYAFRYYKGEYDYLDDGKGKDGRHKATYMYEIRARVNKAGKLGITYYTPVGGEIDDDGAKAIAGALKGQGYKSVVLDKKTLSGAARGMFRKACAKYLIVPDGINFSRKDVTEMLEIAQKENSSEEEIRDFKRRLAAQLRKQQKGKAYDDGLEKHIRESEGYANYSLFNDAITDDIFKDIANKITKTEREPRGAEEVLAAYKGVEALWRIFDKNKELSMKEFLASDALTKTQKERFCQIMLQTPPAADHKLTPQTRLYDLHGRELIALYKALLPDQLKPAQEQLKNVLASKHPNESDTTIALRCINDEKGALEESIGTHLEERGIKGFRLPRPRVSNYDPRNSSRLNQMFQQEMLRRRNSAGYP